MSSIEALQRAIAVCGTQTALADGINEVAARRGVQKQIKTGHIHYWLTTDAVPAEHAPDIEQLTRERGEVVPCEELCPSNNWAAVRCKKPKGKEPSHAEGARVHRPAAATHPVDAPAGPPLMYGDRRNPVRDEIDKVVHGATERPRAKPDNRRER